MPAASDIVITAGGVDITNKVLYASARFEQQLGAIPGVAEITVKDVDQTLEFIAGDELTLDIDGQRLWGGYILTPRRTFAFPVVNTETPGNVTARQWRLAAIDYNILFDKRVIHNSLDHLHHLPFFTLDQTMGDLLRNELFADYLDLDDDGLDVTTFVDDVYVPRFDADGDPDPDATKKGSWPQQGSYWRKAMEDFAQYGAIYYIDAEKNVHFHEVEDSVAPWGFSDVPNGVTTFGMREVEEIQDASAMVNDAFVWGGSEWAGSGGTVFAQRTNATSVTDHGRWQLAEVRFGELPNQGSVNARANVIVSGNTTGAVGGDTSRGLAVVQRQLRLVWLGHDVPTIASEKAHLRASMVVPIQLFVMTEDGIDPLELDLPLRTMTITFPTLPSSEGSPEEPKTFVRFDGFFGVQLSDPYWLWKLLRDLRSRTNKPTFATADGSSTTAIYGTFGSFAPSPAANGSVTVFTVPFAYIPGTVSIYEDGRLARPGIEWEESDPEAGEITYFAAPAGPLWATCRIAGGYS